MQRSWKAKQAYKDACHNRPEKYVKILDNIAAKNHDHKTNNLGNTKYIKNYTRWFLYRKM
jgi:hypothetical protein